MNLEINLGHEFEFRAINTTREIEELSTLLDTCFSVKRGCRFFDDFPIWDPILKVNHVKLFGVFYGGRLIGSCGIRQTRLPRLSFGDFPHEPMQVCLIGAVATHPLWRGRGIASKLVNHALNWGEMQGAVLAFLWGSEHALYERLGFALCGRQIRVRLSNLVSTSEISESLESQDTSGADDAIHKWVPELYGLIQLRTGGLVLRDEDRVWFEAHKNVKWFYSRDESGLEAYVGYERGIDLQGIVHEWGGDKNTLRKILSVILRLNPKAELLGPPELLCELKTLNPSPIVEYLCMAKILKPKLFFSVVYPKISINFAPSRAEWEIRDGNHRLGSVTQSQLVKQCFGPELPLGPLVEMPVSSLWIWGLDAV